MKTITALILSSFALASSMGAAHAGDITPDDTATQVWTHTKTRADVRAELFAARDDGTLLATASEAGMGGAANPTAQGVLAGALRRELRAAQADDLAHAVIGEDSGSFWLSRTTGARGASRTLAGIVRGGER